MYEDFIGNFKAILQAKKNHNLLQLLQDFITFKRTYQAGFTHTKNGKRKKI